MELNNKLKGTGTGNKLKQISYRGLSVLNGELYSDLEALPVSGGLCNVLTNLLGGETKGTDLAGK